jgi:hypothetical protein
VVVVTTIDRSPHGMTEDGAVYKLFRIFHDHPELTYKTIEITDERVMIAAVGTHGVLMNWSRALPDHRTHTCLVPTSYGCDEADVLEAPGIRVTIRRPLVGPGGVS